MFHFVRKEGYINNQWLLVRSRRCGIVTRSDITTDAIHWVISDLIQQKSKRDNVKFTASRLAKELNVPRSLVSRLIHSDPSKRVTNPTIETLIKIIDYFRSDGFDVTLDDLLGLRKQVIDIQAQQTGLLTEKASVPLYSLSDPFGESLGVVETKLVEAKETLLAFQLDRDIQPMFKPGSIFFVDTSLKPSVNMLIAMRFEGKNELTIGKYIISHDNELLLSYYPESQIIKIDVSSSYQVLGGVIQVYANTHHK